MHNSLIGYVKRILLNTFRRYKTGAMKTIIQPLKVLFICLSLWSIQAGVYAQTMVLNKTVENITTGSDGADASQGDILEYTINVRSTSSANFINTRLYDNIPAGVAYIAGSTKMNDISVADVSGRMRFSGNGGLINSPGFGTGILAPNVAVTVVFQVRVTANGGSVSNRATVDGTYNSVSIIQTTETVFTNIDADLSCATIYQMATNSNGEYRVLRSISNNATGAAGPVIYNGVGGRTFTAPTTVTPTKTNLGNGVGLTSCAAIAYDRTSNRIYFVNNDLQAPLSYIKLNAPDTAWVYPNHVLETTNNNGYNINRMAFGSDGFGYALTSNARDLIRFSVNPTTNVPTINRLGALTNDVNNGPANDVLDERGGDIFADGSGKLYMIVNSSKMYKINPATRVTTYMGLVTPGFGSNEPSQSIAITASGTVFIGGAYNNIFRINLATMVRTPVSASGGLVFSGDFTSCGFPVLSSAILADKTARNYNGSPTVVGGDTVIYTITVINIGNINAAGVKLYDYIPPSTSYLRNSTTLNGAPVADVGGIMPFAVTGGRLVSSPGESGGILKPGAPNQAVVTFAVITEPNRQICNQSRITLLDADGNIIFVNSSDPNNPGQTPTCFFSDGVLPLTNLKFKGSLKDDKSVLQWSLSEDENIATYEIEYSENGISFKTIGKVAAKDNGQINNYEFTDVTNLFSSVRYYRIKIIQKGGSSTHSGIIRLNVEGLDIQVVPNPFDKDLNVQLQLKATETVRIQLIDFSGREVFSSSEQLSAGSHSISLRAPAKLAKGMYLLEIKAGNNHVFQKKVLKQ